MKRLSLLLTTLAGLLVSGVAFADEAAPAIDSGATAWMLTSTALVLFMTIPGLALFYGGMVRKKNVLATMMQSFAITALVSVLWMIFGYSLAFDTTGMSAGVTNFSSFIGGFSQFFLGGLKMDSMTGTIPESVFMTFQMTFAIITPALIAGAYADRMKFSSMLVFTTLWLAFVYAPMTHMVWSGDGGFFWDMGVLDFAGGTVVHINAGVDVNHGNCPGSRQAHGLRQGNHGSPQPEPDPDGRCHAVGWLVRLQRRFRRCRRWPRRYGHGRYPDRHRRCCPGLDVR